MHPSQAARAPPGRTKDSSGEVPLRLTVRQRAALMQPTRSAGHLHPSRCTLVELRARRRRADALIHKRLQQRGSRQQALTSLVAATRGSHCRFSA